tara:strand:- start:311 stop:520 length:210 start_codon:yes stop_codon:yes gene_type:complete
MLIKSKKGFKMKKEEKWNHEIVDTIQYLAQLQYSLYRGKGENKPIKNYDDREKIYLMFADLITELVKHK